MAKYLTEATLFAPAADQWATDKGITNSNGGLIVLQTSENLADIANTALARDNLGVKIGEDVQAYNSNLTLYAGGTIPSAFTLSLANKADALQWRVGIGAGTVNSVGLSGGTTGFTFSGGPVTNNGVMTIEGVLAVAHGGTGASDLSGFKTTLGLNNVDNTSDLDKPLSTAATSALTSKLDVPAGTTNDYIRGDGSVALFPTNGGLGGAAISHQDIFDGDGVETHFNLSFNPVHIDNLDITIGGIRQTKTIDYTWVSGTGLDFTTAPPAEKVVVRYIQAVALEDLPVVTTSTDGLMIAADKVKLNSIATGATLNDTDANLKNRANHTGVQTISTVSGLQTALDAALQKTNNLSDLTDTNAAKNNLGIQYRIGFFFVPTPTSSEVIALHITTAAFTIPANFAGSKASVGIFPTASFTLDVQQQVNGSGAFTSIGTITIATNGTITFATVGGTPKSVALGDVIRTVAPVGADATVANGVVTVVGIY